LNWSVFILLRKYLLIERKLPIF